MAWNEVTVIEQKHRLVSLATTGRFTLTELCADFHVSRKTGHKWLRRYQREGAPGLRDRSRRPHGCAHQTAAAIERLILRERRQHRTWGPKKLRRVLHRDHGIRRPPAGSTLRAFRKIMRRHGLPEIIRVDNGTPFASMALGRLSQLSVWWINQGITVEFMRPASPQQNGSHERGHRDLKAEATQPPSPTLAARQRRFDRWLHERNHLRPHEALGMLCPAQIYRRSPRRLGGNDTAFRYPGDYLVRKISSSGHLRHEGHNYHLGEVFANCRVGLHVNPTGGTELYFANRHLGHLLYDPEERFRPKASIVPPDHKPLAKIKPKTKPKV